MNSKPDIPAGKNATGNTISANAELRIGSYKLKLNLVVPTDEVPPESLMPALRELCNQVAAGIAQIAQENGDQVSCRQGCAACCRQYVPVSPAEARLADERDDIRFQLV